MMLLEYEASGDTICDTSEAVHDKKPAKFEKFYADFISCKYSRSADELYDVFLITKRYSVHSKIVCFIREEGYKAGNLIDQKKFVFKILAQEDWSEREWGFLRDILIPKMIRSGFVTAENGDLYLTNLGEMGCY